MAQRLEILITEDNVKHLADAKSVSEQYVNIGFTFASTLQEAEQLVGQNKYDAGVTDVLFPAKVGDEPRSDSGLKLADMLDAKGIPFVFLTAGNHHGNTYVGFKEGLEARWYRRGIIGYGHNLGILISGKVIEGYPEDQNAEKDTKQWDAAISHVILLASLRELDENVRKKFDKTLSANYIFGFSWWGDYGQLTGTMQKLLDESIPLSRDDDVEALKFVRTTLAEYRK